MLRVSNLKKSFDGLVVLDGFELTLPKGGFTVLVGPSGCGKSTFFNVLTGVVPRDEGEISWLGESVSHIGQKAAYMQQKDLLLPWLTLLDNALLPTKVVKGNADSKDRVHYLFERLGLQGFESYSPQTVSGGMRQRCALVRTLMFDHELVLLDEPLSALDAITRRSLQSLLLLLQSEFNKTILMITHDIEEALILADDVLVLTAFPMSVGEHFSLKTPKPRRASDEELVRIKEHVLDELQEESNNRFVSVCSSSSAGGMGEGV